MTNPSGGFRVVVDVGPMASRIERMRREALLAWLHRVGAQGAMVMTRDSTQSFQRQADPVTGAPWKPSVRAIKQHGQTLLDTGRLRRSVRAEYEVEGDVVHINGGTLPLAYAAVHQFGGRRTPQRRFVGLSQESIGYMRRLFAELWNE